jgi:hypothetical protein
MSDEGLEAKLVKKTVSILQMARKVIERMHADREEGFQEEPSLSDLVLVAQIIGQTATISHLEGIGVPQSVADYPTRLGEAPEMPADQGRAIAFGFGVPDLAVLWSPDGWYIHTHPDFKLVPICCESQESLASTLQQLSAVCGQHRIPPPPFEELAQEPE